MFTPLILAAATLVSTAHAYSQNFTIIDGQIRTPGHVIIDSPQPWTPVGGDSLHISLDVTAGGKIPLPPYEDDARDVITDVAIFLTSRITGLNFTITYPITLQSSHDFNQTFLENFDSAYNSTLVMWQEPSSSVKHVKWRWPDCFASQEAAEEQNTVEGRDWTYRGGRPLGAYNVSIHQYGRIAGESYFSVFNLPIIIKDDIPNDGPERYSCFALRSGLAGLAFVWTDQLEGMGWWEYPWTEGVDAERVAVESRDVAEFLGEEWKVEENEIEKDMREMREMSPPETFSKNGEEAGGGGTDGVASGEAADATAGAIEGVGVKETAPLMLIAAAAGLAFFL